MRANTTTPYATYIAHEAAHWTGLARFARNVALFLAAPFVGLAYALAAPFVGLGAIAWLGVRAALKRRGA